MYDRDQNFSITAVYTFRSSPRSYKSIGDVKIPQIGLVAQSVVFDGKTVWKMWNGATTEGDDGEIREAHIAAHYSHVRNLFPLLDKNQFTLSLLSSSKIKGKDTLGVRASSKGHPDIDLYFDKKTWLPMKSEYRFRGKSGDQISHEEYYEDYKSLKYGIVYPAKRTIIENGEKRFELELVDIELLSEVKDAEFAKP